MDMSRFKGITMHVFQLENMQWGVSEDITNPNPLIIEFEAFDAAMDFARRQAEKYESEVLVHGTMQEPA